MRRRQKQSTDNANEKNQLPINGETLVTAARDPTGKKPDFVTRRKVLASGKLEQINEHNGMTMMRILEKK